MTTTKTATETYEFLTVEALLAADRVAHLPDYVRDVHVGTEEAALKSSCESQCRHLTREEAAEVWRCTLKTFRTGVAVRRRSTTDAPATR
jgi:hypothetical protein